MTKIVALSEEEEDYETLYKEMRNPTLWRSDSVQTHGSKKNQRYLLSEDNTLHKTHCIMLQAKQKLVVLAGGKPPVYPVINPEETISNRVVSKGLYFGRYIVANYLPYTRSVPPTLPTGVKISFDWKGFCKLCDYLYSPNASCIYRGRLLEIESLAFGTRDHPVHGKENKKLMTQFRFQGADDLDDQKKLNPFNLESVKKQQQQRRLQENFFDENVLSKV